MYDRFSTLRKDMDVYDVDGDKIGKVDHVYQAAVVSTTPSTLREPVGEPYMKLDTGFLGLGKHLYIPASAIADISGDRVTLSVDKDRINDKGWDHRPDWLRDVD